ncbi:DUF2271 domain-containing protein [Paludibaculum fermentans]|uniref:DUF2271 domain-containing protein n=1 Tax=Paludibaculum fermentans TaxID=1473598 RepID=UPI003EBC1032
MSVWIAGVVLTLPAMSAASMPGSRERLQTFHHENVLGTSMELKVSAATRAEAEAAESAALKEIDRLARILSSYDAQSEVSRWARTSGEAVRVSPELMEVLGLFDQWRTKTGGALDASAEVVSRVWKQAAAQGRVPAGTELAAAVAEVRQQHWSLDQAAGTATHTSGAALALNSFTKSYIVNRAAEAALASEGVRAVVVNIGGDLVVRGSWTEGVGVADPLADGENGTALTRLRVADRAVATSGNYRRGFDIGGRHYSHIVDPRTGETAEDVVSATVVAPDAVDAGALATAFCVMTPAESLALASTMEDVEFLIVDRSGRRTASPGWSGLEAPRVQAAGFAAKGAQGAVSAPAAGGMELLVQLELARIEDARARRPFVAVWIEDKDHVPVRTIALWFDKDRWLPDLKSWYRGDRLRAMAEGTEITGSVSSATRPPGKYTLRWDGKDDKGKAVKPGKYTVCIEAAREHGTYQIMRQEMDFSGAPKQVQLAGNPEIAGASLDYRKASR